MKKTLLIGVATILTLTSFEAAFAAGSRNVVTERVEREANGKKKLSDLVEIKGMQTKQIHEAVASKLEALVATREGAVDRNALADAMGRTLKVKVAGEVKDVTVLSVARTILEVEAITKAIREDVNRGTAKLSKEAEADLALKERGLKESVRALSLLAKTSEVSTVLSAETQLNIRVLHKQLSLIPEVLTKMNKEEATSHIEILQLAADAKISRDTKGDDAMNVAFQKKHGKEAEARKKKVDDC